MPEIKKSKSAKLLLPTAPSQDGEVKDMVIDEVEDEDSMFIEGQEEELRAASSSIYQQDLQTSQ